MLYVVCDGIKVGVCGDPTGMRQNTEIDVGYILLYVPTIPLVSGPHDVPQFDLATESGDYAYDRCKITRWGTSCLTGEGQNLIIENATLTFLQHRS